MKKLTKGDSFIKIYELFSSKTVMRSFSLLSVWYYTVWIMNMGKNIVISVFTHFHTHAYFHKQTLQLACMACAHTNNNNMKLWSLNLDKGMSLPWLQAHSWVITYFVTYILTISKYTTSKPNTCVPMCIFTGSRLKNGCS